VDSGLDGEDREVRAARNQALFRTVNDKLKGLSESFSAIVGTHVIACECADLNCIESFDIESEAYSEVRAHPRRFVVLRGHIYPDIERVTAENDGYVVVEKFAAAGEVSEAIYEGKAPDPAEAESLDPVDLPRQQWALSVARATRKAADELRELDDPTVTDLLHDLDELYDRLAAELQTAGLEP
jgi:hypothetical protein